MVVTIDFLIILQNIYKKHPTAHLCHGIISDILAVIYKNVQQAIKSQVKGAISIMVFFFVIISFCCNSIKLIPVHHIKTIHGDVALWITKFCWLRGYLKFGREQNKFFIDFPLRWIEFIVTTAVLSEDDNKTMISHHENHQSVDLGRQNTHRTGKPPLYNHV